MKRWIILLLCLISLPLQAAWYKTIGSAAIINNDEEYARQQAIQDALRQAMLKAGASVSSIQKLSKGAYRDWETDRKSTRLNSSHRSLSRMPSSA